MTVERGRNIHVAPWGDDSSPGTADLPVAPVERAQEGATFDDTPSGDGRARRRTHRRFHATVWPELEQLLRDAGVTTYVIHAWDAVVFSHMEVEDYRMVERFNGDPVAQRREEEVGELIEYPDADPETGWPRMLDEVWSL